jgi:DNA-binding MarR family transcriptional regulator
MRRDGERRGAAAKSDAGDAGPYARAAAVCACANFRKAARAVTQLFDEALQPTGLRSTQLIVLLEVAASEPASVTRLARKLVMDPSTVTRNLQPLLKRGLLESVAGDRNQALRLTVRGRDALAQAVPLWEQTQSSFVGRFGPERWQGLLKDLSHAVVAARADAAD